MKKLCVAILALSSISLFGQSQEPKLVIGIVVDQMRQDYLYRYWDTFGEGGFKRLVENGFMAKNAHYNYVPTNTGPGHASVYTGTTPTNNGIIGNAWYIRSENRFTNCVGDPDVLTVGAENDRGKASPKWLISSTITDELKLASQSRSKVVSVSIKDRGSILPAGHMADGAYWFDAATGAFVSSTYYMEKLPRWAEKFNKQKLPAEYANETWDLLLDKKSYTASGPDNSPYEVVLRGKSTPEFPYVLPELLQAYGDYNFLPLTPFGNQIVLDMAIAALEGESLGQDEETDFLAISFSSTDYAGHAWGPNSMEVQDMYLRLDKNMELLLNTLDETIGENNYLVFLTSDHGVVDVPARLDTLKVPAGYTRINIGKEVNDYLMLALGKQVQFVKNVSNQQIYLDRELLSGNQLEDAARIAADYLRAKDGIFQVYTAGQLMDADFTSGGLKGMMVRGYNQERSGDVFYSLFPAHSSSGSEQGTGHGTGFTYDSHVPLIMYGKGINPGHSPEYYSVSDIAPTISVLLNIRFPNASTGQPITEALK